MKTRKLCIVLLICSIHYIKPTNFTDSFNAGIKNYKEKKYEIAAEQFRSAIVSKPDSIDAHYNLAFMLKLNGDIYEALEHYRYVLSNKPDNLSAYGGFGQSCLATGNYEEGWRAVEFWRLGSLKPYILNIKEYIHAQHSFSGKKIFIQAEWGIGDTLMFLRYAKLLHEKGAHVIFRPMNQKLIPLLQLQPYIQVVRQDQTPELCHFQIPMVSLPYIFGTTVSTVPTSESYIKGAETLIAHWKEKLSHDKNFKIGICWHGETYNEETKFMPLEYYAQLAKIPGITLYSLQKQHGLDQLATLSDKTIIQTFDETFDHVAFLDTAAVIKNLDLVITTDTSIAHLAGALGIPVWVTLHYPCEWRWMLDRSDSPWYPSMRLFRQEKNGGWQKVIDTIKANLTLVIVNRKKFLKKMRPAYKPTSLIESKK